MGFLDIFVPKWNNRDPEIRLSAVVEMTNLKRLTSIAKEDSNGEVRVAAIKRLGELADGESYGPYEDLETLLSDSEQTVRSAAVYSSGLMMKARREFNERKTQNCNVGELYNIILNANVEYDLVYGRLENKLIEIIKENNHPDIKSVAIDSIRYSCINDTQKEEMSKKLAEAGVEINGF